MDSFWQRQLLITGIDLTSVTAIKAAVVSGNDPLMMGASGFGSLAYYTMGLAIKERGQAQTNAVANMLSTLASVLIGVLYWKEQMDQRKMFGIALALASIYFLG